MLNKTYSLRLHCVSCWTTYTHTHIYIHCKMIHCPYNVKTFFVTLCLPLAGQRSSSEANSHSYGKKTCLQKHVNGLCCEPHKSILLLPPSFLKIHIILCSILRHSLYQLLSGFSERSFFISYRSHT